MKKIVIICLITGLFLPLMVQGEVEPPKNLEEAKGFSLDIIKKLPEAMKRVWREEVLPIWQKIWQWLKIQLQKLWGWFKIQLQKLWNWILGLLGREVEKVKSEAKEKQEEIQKSLWQKFKDLFK